MRHYTITDQFYYSDVKSRVASASEVSSKIDLAPASKTLFLRNDGPNDVFIAFDADTATTKDFKLTAADGLVKIKAQCVKLALVCNAGETASVRISSNF